MMKSSMAVLRVIAGLRRLATQATGHAVVHPTAVVHAGALLEPGVQVGPLCVVGPGVRLRAGVHLIASVHVAGATDIGPSTRVYPFACLGFEPQDLKHGGEPTRLRIGARCVVREHVTAHTGTAAGGGLTSIGDDCLLMAGAHVAHDCALGAGAIVANAALLAGHVRVGERAIIGGGCALHQFVTVGRGAMVGGGSVLAHDVPPFTLARGSRALLRGVNLVGLRRARVPRDEAARLLQAFRRLFGGYGTYFAPPRNFPPGADSAGGARATLAELAARELGGEGAAASALVRELALFVVDPSRRRPVCAADGGGAEPAAVRRGSGG